jgi:hypothetical protein
VLAQENGSLEQAVNLLEKYCAECHRGDDAKGEFSLAELHGQNSASLLDRWEQIAKSLDGYMPPEDSPQPTVREKQQLLRWIENRTTRPEPGSVRRMNRVEYENTIRDLFELSREAFSNPDKIVMQDDYFRPDRKRMPRYVFAASHFSHKGLNRPELLHVGNPPIDLPAEHGFTNDVDALQFSPVLAEKYFELSEEIVNSPTLPVISSVYDSLFAFDRDEKATGRGRADEARSRLKKFLPRAFRRPVNNVEVERFVKVFEDQREDSGSFEIAMKRTIAAILISPDFLFLFRNPEEFCSPNQRISILNASRLSYFLWASMPDHELLEMANAGELVTGEQLQRQAERMLLDRKVKSLATDFGMQWLKVNRLFTSQPDIEEYAEFYRRKGQPISVAMMIEQMLFFETVLVEDLSITEFVHSDFAYLNRDLMFWYGYGPDHYVGFTPDRLDREDFFRIRLPKSDGRGGVITAGSTLVLTSTSLRTSPVFRGAWVAETIFNRPPPPPPPNVPALEKPGNETTKSEPSIRQRLDIHRKNPNCYSCHAKIDPLGFGLEQFDAVGRLRQVHENGERVDSSGKLDGHEFEDAYTFKQTILRAKKDRFTRAFVEHLLRYAINRKLTLADAESVKAIVDEARKEDFRFQSVVAGIVASDVFRAR